MRILISLPLVCTVLFSSIVGSLHAKQLVWNWLADESQVKNFGQNPDGSTDSLATGSGAVIYDTETNILKVEYQWNNLFGELTKLHVHGPATAEMSNPQHIIETFGPPDIPASLDLRNDSWTDSFELQTLSQPGFPDLTPAQIVQIMEDGLAYVNIHTSVFGMGEIRGNLGLPTVIPEPSATLLLFLSMFGISLRRPARI